MERVGSLVVLMKNKDQTMSSTFVRWDDSFNAKQMGIEDSNEKIGNDWLSNCWHVRSPKDNNLTC